MLSGTQIVSEPDKVGKFRGQNTKFRKTYFLSQAVWFEHTVSRWDLRNSFWCSSYLTLTALQPVWNLVYCLNTGKWI